MNALEEAGLTTTRLHYTVGGTRNRDPETSNDLHRSDVLTSRVTTICHLQLTGVGGNTPEKWEFQVHFLEAMVDMKCFRGEQL